MSTNFNDYKPNYLKIEALGTNDSAINNMTISFHCANYYPSVTLINDNPTLGNITGGGVYFTGSNVTISATPNTNYTFVGWYDTLNNLVSTESSYTFAMPSNDVTYHAKFTTLSKGATTQFGTYPQSKVTDATLISTLNTAAGTLPTSGNNRAWTDYGYYVNSNVSSYMWYIDVPNSGNLYRGVYFTGYRPFSTSYSSSSGDSSQDEHGYYKNETYWFKYEPISWKVLDIAGGKAFLLADLAIDAQDYYHSKFPRDINGTTVYPNNYEHSHIRAWLNDTFYNTAFTTMEKIMIDNTNVDNSVSSTGYDPNPYVCDSTNDKVFLLSYSEVTNTNYGFDAYHLSTDINRGKSPSDYALSQGVNRITDSNSSYYWLRSPHSGNYENARRVRADGMAAAYNIVTAASYGVVPALWIIL